ncbi:hypothetical protein Tco_0593069 [Tanacetum coccineum]
MCSKVTKAEGNDGVEVIIVNVIPPDHDHDVPVVEPESTMMRVPVCFPEPVLENEDEDPKETEKKIFEEEEDPQEDEGIYGDQH